MDEKRYFKVILSWVGSKLRSTYFSKARADWSLDHIRDVWSRTYPGAKIVDVLELTDDELKWVKEADALRQYPSYVSAWG